MIFHENYVLLLLGCGGDGIFVLNLAIAKTIKHYVALIKYNTS